MSMCWGWWGGCRGACDGGGGCRGACAGDGGGGCR